MRPISRAVIPAEAGIQSSEELDVLAVSLRPLGAVLFPVLFALGVTAPSLAAQATSGGDAPRSWRVGVVPFLSAGARAEGDDSRIPQFSAGVQVEGAGRWLVRPTLAASGWMMPLTCMPSLLGPERDRIRCANLGWSVDVGANLAPRRTTQVVQPYIGGGVGAFRSGETFPAANVRAGLELPATSRAALRLELRHDHVLGGADMRITSSTAGLRLGF